jgi:hypothetical protein
LQCNEEKIKRKLMAIATGLINDNAMQCGIRATEERSRDDSGTSRATIELAANYVERRAATG